MSSADRKKYLLETGSMNIEAQAAEWVTERHGSKEWTADDQARLDAWLGCSLAHRVAYVRLDSAWRRTNRLAALRTPVSNAAPPAAARTRSAWMIAALVFVVLAGGGILSLSLPRERTIATGVGEHRSVMLSDGSRIDLNTDTVLRMSANADQRTVFLDKGEAFFQVKHNAAQKFVVMAAGHRVTDLGTKFVIRNGPVHLQVALLEGRARIESLGGSQSQRALLSPGDFAVVTARSISVTKKSVRAVADEIAWRQGELVFHFTPLADAAAEFNRYNQKKIIIADGDIAHRQIGGTFATSDVSLFGRVAKDLLGVRVDDRGAEIVISR